MASSNFPDRVQAELAKARDKHGPMTGPHEAYAVLLEELEEVWEEIKKDAHKSPVGRTMIVDELAQLGAMCQRAAEDVFADAVSWTYG